MKDNGNGNAVFGFGKGNPPLQHQLQLNKPPSVRTSNGRRLIQLKLNLKRGQLERRDFFLGKDFNLND